MCDQICEKGFWVIPGETNKEYKLTFFNQIWYAYCIHRGDDHPYQILASYVWNFPNYNLLENFGLHLVKPLTVTLNCIDVFAVFVAYEMFFHLIYKLPYSTKLWWLKTLADQCP